MIIKCKIVILIQGVLFLLRVYYACVAVYEVCFNINKEEEKK